MGIKNFYPKYSCVEYCGVEDETVKDEEFDGKLFDVVIRFDDDSLFKIRMNVYRICEGMPLTISPFKEVDKWLLETLPKKVISDIEFALLSTT